MVKMQAVQSALAVRRQRCRREEQKRAQKRRESGASLSSPRPSVVSLDGHVYFDEKKERRSMFGQVTMFHVGGVLILIGLMLTVTALMPSYVRSTTPERRSDLLGTGCFFVFIGGVLTTISRFVSNSEEKELNQYIQRRLARSKSGHRLVRDVEAGGGGFPTPTRDRKHKTHQNGVATTLSEPNTPGKSSSGSNRTHGDYVYPEVHQCKSGSQAEIITSEASCAFVVGCDDTISPSASTEPVLSRILEEDEFDEGEQTTEPLDSTPETSSLSPTSPLETQGLLDRHYSPRKSSRASSSKSLRIS